MAVRTIAVSIATEFGSPRAAAVGVADAESWRCA